MNDISDISRNYALLVISLFIGAAFAVLEFSKPIFIWCVEYIWRNCLVHEISYEEYLEIHAQLKKLAGRARDYPMVGDPLTEMLILIGDRDRFRADWLASLYKLVDKARKEYLKGIIDRKVEDYLREGMRQKEVYNSLASYISFLGQVVFYVSPRVRQGLMKYIQTTIKTTAQNIRA